MKNEIKGDTLPVVICHLEAGERMITERGSMAWMSPNMKMETISGGGMKKMFGRLMSGDSVFQNRYTAEGTDGMIAFASSFPGAIKALEISNGHSMIVQKSAFLASEEGVLAFTVPASRIAPPCSSSFSVNVVLPASGWEIIPKIRRF